MNKTSPVSYEDLIEFLTDFVNADSSHDIDLMKSQAYNQTTYSTG